MTFTESDFTLCKFNVFEVKKPFDKYPELKVLYAEVAAMCSDEAWKEFIEPEQLAKYIVYCYHKQSPLISKIAELRERKTQALMLAGLDVAKLQKNPIAKKIIADILLSRHEFTTRFAFHFLKQENNVLWNEYAQLLDILEDANFEMANSNESEKLSAVEVAQKKAAVYKGIQMYREDLNKIADKLMAQDSDMRSFMSSQIMLTRRNRLITPEDYVRLSKEELEDIFRQNNLLKTA